MLVTMTFFKTHGCVQIQLALGSRDVASAGNLVSHVTFDNNDPEIWSAVSCGLVAILL